MHSSLTFIPHFRYITDVSVLVPVGGKSMIVMATNALHLVYDIISWPLWRWWVK